MELDDNVVVELEQPWSSNGVARTSPIAPEQGDGSIATPSSPAPLEAVKSMTRLLRPDIAFSVNLLARYSSTPTMRHWKGVKDVLRYLRGTTDMGLFYSGKSTNDQILAGYEDAGFLSDPYKAHSQTGYVFTNGDTAFS
ncbi:uncharacterized mitochondrial protein AtMg00240-like [Pyrus communis]|uniref:uncharacterized mitochondrial protein AtMg00240-like n=1 Tax=Pyrus communis TaxID=23211 RepID=UPI0035C1CCC7